MNTKQATLKELLLLTLALGFCLGLGMFLGGGCATAPSLWVLQSADPPLTLCPVCNAQEIQPIGQRIFYNAGKTVKTSVVYWQCQSYLCGAVSETVSVYTLRPTARRLNVSSTVGLKLRMNALASIPGGPFIMGDASGTTGTTPVHSVNVSPFLMDSNLVTYALWTHVYQWGVGHGYVFGSKGAGKKTRTDNPVQTVSWYDAVKWCNARSEMEGLRPCYYSDTNKTMLYKTGNSDLIAACVDWKSGGYRLPTEAEWEKAARGGLVGKRLPWGETISQGQANYHSYAIGYPSWDLSRIQWNPVGQIGGNPGTSPVGSFRRNAYGLADMAGNVEEWVWDRYSSKYYGSFPANAWSPNPTGPDAGQSRVTRGGAWSDDVTSLLCGARSLRAPKYTSNAVGFRCVKQ